MRCKNVLKRIIEFFCEIDFSEAECFIPCLHVRLGVNEGQLNAGPWKVYHVEDISHWEEKIMEIPR